MTEVCSSPKAAFARRSKIVEHVDVSVYLQTWLIQIAAMLALLVGFFAQNGWPFALGITLFFIAAFWPRCPQCKLATFWRRGPNDPDHFVYYLGKRLPGRSCSRCGEDLTL
jgi:hypothetical protein